MKHYEYISVDADFDPIDSEIFVGSASEIRSLYKAFVRSYNKGTSDLYPVFAGFPMFSDDRTYGIEVKYNGHFSVLSETVVLAMFSEGAMLPVSDCGDCTPPVEEDIDLFPDCEVDLEF